MSETRIMVGVLRSSVMERVERATAYAGAKGAGKGDVERVAATEADGELLQSYWREGVRNITRRLEPWIEESEENRGAEAGHSFLLRLPSRHNSGVAQEIEDGVESSLASHIISRWYQMVDPEKAAEAAAMADIELQLIVGLVCSRRRPERNQRPRP